MLTGTGTQSPGCREDLRAREERRRRRTGEGHGRECRMPRSWGKRDPPRREEDLGVLMGEHTDIQGEFQGAAAETPRAEGREQGQRHGMG